MSMLSDWVIQIIIFIFIGTILELIIPNNSMKRYVHIVVGLILLLILVKPILYMFSVNIPAALDQVEQTLFTQDELLFSSEKQLEEQKSEILAEQDAYIWNEITSQLIHEANSVLETEYDGTTVSDISFETNDHEALELENIEKIIVTLETTESDQKEVSIVQPVEIGEDSSQEEFVESVTGNKIRKTLAELWGVEEEQIEYVWEEGAT